MVETFTEKDRADMNLLPEQEKAAFFTRFSDIAMRKHIADSAWETAMEKAAIDADILIKEIKESLEKVRK